MTEVFADTSFYVALLNVKDQLHAASVRFAKENRRVLTSEFVLIEVGNFLARPVDRRAFIRLVGSLDRSSKTEVLPSSAALFAAGMNVFRSRPDKAWSVTDCISFSIMDHRKIREALTADRHFEQAGFIPLLR